MFRARISSMCPPAARLLVLLLVFHPTWLSAGEDSSNTTVQYCSDQGIAVDNRAEIRFFSCIFVELPARNRSIIHCCKISTWFLIWGLSAGVGSK